MLVRLLAATAVLCALAAPVALAGRKDDKDGQQTPPASMPGRGPNHHGSERTGPARPFVPPQQQDRGRGHDARDAKFPRRYGVIFWPYPYPWPYGGYYSNYGNPYAYPYPGPYPAYPYYPDDDVDYTAMPSTRGLVVPGDLPMGSAANWFYCDSPDGFYPYVKSCSRNWTPIPLGPPPPGASKPLSYSEWQWCEESKSFFPYVTSCKEGFVSVPVTVPTNEGGPPPQAANWFFCDDPKGYSPYVVQCKHDWRAVPAVPPPSVKISVRDEDKSEKPKKK